MEAYDYLLVNDDLTAVWKMHNLIQLQHRKTCYHLDLSRMREELYHLDDLK